LFSNNEQRDLPDVERRLSVILEQFTAPLSATTPSVNPHIIVCDDVGPPLSTAIVEVRGNVFIRDGSNFIPLGKNIAFGINPVAKSNEADEHVYAYNIYLRKGPIELKDNLLLDIPISDDLQSHFLISSRIFRFGIFTHEANEYELETPFSDHFDGMSIHL
jgi:hypothetical protein